MSETAKRLRITFENERPIELAEFTASLAAVADEYRRFTGNENGRLCVERITEGSIDTFLTEVAQDVGPFVQAVQPMVGIFIKHWFDLLKMLASYGKDAITDKKAKQALRSSIRNAMTFVNPVINGNPMIVTGDYNTVTQVFNVDVEAAGDILRNGRHLLAPDIAEEARFSNEAMKLYQARDAKAGDLGFIDRFGSKARRLIFATDAIKSEILHCERGPFDVFFYVSGLVKTAGGEVAGYYIDKIDGITERDVA
jgi:hypothetical protein